jgi:ribosomal protein L13E
MPEPTDEELVKRLTDAANACMYYREIRGGRFTIAYSEAAGDRDRATAAILGRFADLRRQIAKLTESEGSGPAFVTEIEGQPTGDY